MKNSLNGSVVTSLQECTDVNITPGAGEDGKVVTYDHASAKFVLAAASGGISKIEDADDVNVTLGVGEDEKALCYDHDTGKFVLRQVTIGACLLSSGATVGASSQAQAFTNGVKTGFVFPASDGTTAFQIRKADGSTSVLNVNTTSARVGIGTTSPSYSLHVAGALFAQVAYTHDVFRVESTIGYRAYSIYAIGESYARMYLIGSTLMLGGGSAVADAGLARRDVGLLSIDGNSAVGYLSVTGKIGAGILATSYPATPLEGNGTDAVTNAVTNILTVRHASSGTPAAGFGAGIRFGLESSTTENTDAALIEALWNEATHASRKADLVLSAYDTAKREGLRIRGAGSAPAIGFLGATPAARIAHVVDAVTAHAVTDPGDSPADADSLRDDLVTNVIPSLETQLNNLGTVINSILTTLETFGFHATS